MLVLLQIRGFLRVLINTCTQLAARGVEDGVESEQLLDDAERMIMDLSQNVSAGVIALSENC